MLDRKTPPKSLNIEQIYLPKPLKENINASIPLFSLLDKEHNVIKLDLISNSGMWHEEKKGVAYFASKMLKGGTKTKSSSEIENELDFYGCNFSNSVKKDTFGISIVTLNKYFEPIINLLEELIFNSIFPENFFNTLKAIEKNKLIMEDSQNSVFGLKILKELVFGSEHPYGIRYQTQDFDNLELNDVKNYFLNNLFSDTELFICGNFSNKDLNYLNNSLKKLRTNSLDTKKIELNNKPSKKVINRKDTLQETVVLGKIFPIKSHEDFKKLIILNELLGGYFGSKLMSNIREKSGYTYGIYSAIVPMKQASLFYISSEISKNHSNKVTEQIILEIEKLQTKLISKTELNDLKSHMKGKLLLSKDDIFSKMDSFIGVHIHGLNMNYYNELFRLIENITPEILMEMAKTYLKIDTLSQVIIKE